jgi:Uma2 family endonuclease
MAPLAKKTEEKFSYADYLKWPVGERFELIEGVPYDMSPAPGVQHQSISFELSGLIYNFLKNKSCRAFTAPFDVRFIESANSKDKEIFTVVQPDITIICDEKKIDAKGCIGSPDVIIEILSPSTAYKDETEKLKLYEKHGVKEYWIVNPDARYLLIYRIEDKNYGKPEYLTEKEILESRVLTGLRINLAEIWG